MNPVALLTIVALLALAAPMPAASDVPQQLAQQAVDAYSQALDTEQRDLRLAGFRKAERLFARLAEGESRNADLYTNLGNAALQAEHLGTAVLAYRRALALDPDYPRAVQNLEHARSLLPEWVPRPASTGLLDTFFLWHRTLSRSERSLAAGLAFAAGGLLVALGLRFGRKGNNATRNAAVLPALVWVVLLASVAFDSGGTLQNEAVLVADETVARAADSALAPQTLPAPLPGGVEVQILERRTPWLRIRLASGRDAWIPESAVSRVIDSNPTRESGADDANAG
jgi:tetratricopeptide (TPR) repeat protein